MAKNKDKKKIPFNVFRKGMTAGALGLAMLFSGAGMLAGCTGEPGARGETGATGKSAYELAVENGFTGTLTEWLESLKGQSGGSGSAGKGIESITKTGTNGLVDIYTITFSDGTSTTFEITNGENGTAGASSYTHIKYANEMPDSNDDILASGTGAYIGIYTGTSATAPSDYTSYTWNKIAGENGTPGASSYTHIKYANEMPDSNDDILASGTGAYIGIYTGTSATAPSDYTSYTWNKIAGENGSTPVITFDDEGYIVIDGVKSEICIYGNEVERDITYNSTTLTNYEFKVLQGNALASPESNRVSLWFDYKFKAGTEFKLVGDLTTYNAGFSISRDGKEYDARTTTLAEDSGWISNSTTTGDLNVGLSSLKHHYDATTKTLTLAKDSYVRMNFKNTASSTGTAITPSTYDWKNFVEISGKYLEQDKSVQVKYEDDERDDIDYIMNAVAHRGYSTDAPENTLSAYRLAKAKGFDMAECDVTFTKDGVGVLLHDDTINRTSNGSGNIADLTLEQVREYDFGSWKSSEYIGEKIPTFEEFIILCKYLAIHPYIEIKGGATQANVESLVTTVTRAGMLDEVTWISFDINMLTYVKNVDETARLGYLASPITEQKITELKALRTGKNEVFFSADNTKVTEPLIERCIEENIPLEVCTVDDINVIENLHPYISGVTSNCQISGEILYNKYK